MGQVTHIVAPSGAAEFALAPLEGLAEMFAEARLHFRRRRAPDSLEPWTPDRAVVWFH